MVCQLQIHRFTRSPEVFPLPIRYFVLINKSIEDYFPYPHYSMSLSYSHRKPCIEWTWEAPDGSDFVNLLNDNKDVKFHRNFSSGTAVVRGAQPLTQDQYFWEIKMISPVYGTDMMVGIGTPEASMAQVHDKFISLLGNDKQTWGLSYTGLFHHNGESRSYASRFGQGSIIGVHLDLWNGTLSFYKNRKHLGIASRGLTGKTLYAMASSTAACSGMRIVRSCSFPSSLQFLCCAKLRELIPDEKSVLKSLEIPPGLKQFLDNNLGWFLGPRFNECVLYPSLPKRSWSFALKPDSDDPLLTDVIRGPEGDRDSEDDESMIVIQGRALYLQYGGRRFGPGCSRLSQIRTSQSSSPQSSCPQFSSPSSSERAMSGGFLSGASTLASTSFGSHNGGSQRGLLKDILNEASESASYDAHSSEYRRASDFSNETSMVASELEHYDLHCSEYHRGLLKDFRIEPDVASESYYDSMDSLEMIEITDEEDVLESPAKRRCSSYNYIMGLSDPDTESETADSV